MTFDAGRIRADFPLLRRCINDRPLRYLDSANTSQKPQVVIDAMSRYYETTNANVHRGSYQLAVEATDALEGARATVARFIGAAGPHEVVFTKNATEALNLVANSWGRANLGPGDAVVLSEMEHHANIVPWHMLVAERGIELRWIPIDEGGQLDLSDLDRLLDGAKLVAVTAMSNVLGTITPSPSCARPPTGPAPRCWSTPVNWFPTAGSTSAPSAPTWSPSPATRCSAPWESACCGGGPRRSKRCPRSSVAAR
ncbi:MAG: aminotransferase class V-fold PLP-dependent enzyme [Acidimicrobiia bacterium]|nr:aminotransferase class V-fold PLP-dependent enzyme [Acidimicrobiia bacterium]